MPETVNGDTVSAMMMNPGKQTYRLQIRSLWIWALLVAVLMAVIVPGAQAALSENRTRGYHNFFVDRTGLEPDLNAELHWVYGNFYDDFAPGSLVASKKAPIWSSTKNKTSVENAFSHFKKHGNEFSGIQNSKQYVEKARDFLSNPPKGTLTKTRPNGDILRYNPKTNTFGVQRADGAPRTMFKPKDGINYWNKQ